MLAYREWRQLFETGKLNAVHSRFFRARQAEELYDLTTDPHETQNLASNPKYAKTVLELRQKLSAHIKATLDLSMFPESLLFDKAFDNPAQFGKNRKNEISELVDIADLSLSRFAPVRDELHWALHSKKPWHRYWALIACSCDGKLASEFYTAAEKIAVADPNRLVRVRAAEFLALAAQIQLRIGKQFRYFNDRKRFLIQRTDSIPARRKSGRRQFLQRVRRIADGRSSRYLILKQNPRFLKNPKQLEEYRHHAYYILAESVPTHISR